MPSRTEKAHTFRSLHERDGAFIIPNPWDLGSARILESMGFEALATTSAGLAFSMGMLDNTVSRDDVLAHCRAITDAVDVPVNADLGNCFGDEPETVAETFRLAAETGVAGASVEDMAADGSIYEFGLAVERVQAACAVARGLDTPLLVTARCENFLAGRKDLADTIARLQAYREAGADVLYAPGLMSADEIRTAVQEAGAPVNVLAAGRSFTLTLSELEELGVKRISTGGALARSALTALVSAAKEMQEQGTFTYPHNALSASEISELLS